MKKMLIVWVVLAAIVLVLIVSIISIATGMIGSILASQNLFNTSKDGWEVSTAIATIIGTVGTVGAAVTALIVWVAQNAETKRVSVARAEMAAARLVRTVIALRIDIKRMTDDKTPFGSSEFLSRHRFLQEDFYIRYRDDLYALTVLDKKTAVKLSYAFGNLEGISFQYKTLVLMRDYDIRKLTPGHQFDTSTWYAWAGQAEKYLAESIPPMRALVGDDIFNVI